MRSSKALAALKDWVFKGTRDGSTKGHELAQGGENRVEGARGNPIVVRSEW